MGAHPLNEGVPPLCGGASFACEDAPLNESADASLSELTGLMGGGSPEACASTTVNAPDLQTMQTAEECDAISSAVDINDDPRFAAIGSCMIGCCVGGPVCAGALGGLGYVTAQRDTRIGWISRGVGRPLNRMWTSSESCRFQTARVTGAQTALDSCIRFDREFGISDTIVSHSRRALVGVESSVRMVRDGIRFRASRFVLREQESTESENVADMASASGTRASAPEISQQTTTPLGSTVLQSMHAPLVTQGDAQ